MMIQQTIQTILTAIFVIFAGPIAEAITPEWWYGLGAILSAVSLVAAFFFVPETKYHRPKSSFQSGGSSDDETVIVVCTERPELDYVNFAPRTWRSDLRLWVGAPEWNKIIEIFSVSVAALCSFTIYKSANICQQTFGLMLFPNVLWALCLNGLTLGVNIAIGTTVSVFSLLNNVQSILTLSSTVKS